MTQEATLSDHLSRYADEHLAARRALLEPVWDSLEEELSGLEPDAAMLLRYLYGTLPLTDCFDTEPAVLRAYVDHALMLRREMPWCHDMPEGLFVHYVLCPRINNEPLTDCRGTFFGLLHERVAGMDAYDAVREVNYWCAEQATYQASDGRTLGPLAVLSSGSGRCGEESTFLVTALRSIGIPARQIYTPWWAHCDDNHAWVEAHTGDGWHYLGACEPEEELDRGWFTNAAGRAPMEETNLFSDFMDDSVAGQDAGRVGCTHLQDVTDSYARSTKLEVRVCDADGAPVAGAVVNLEVLNMATWMTAATLTSDADGRVELTVGRCTLRVHASKDDIVAFGTVDTRETDSASLTLVEPGCAVTVDGQWHDYDVAAPADNPAPSHAQTPEQDERARTRKAACDTTRRARIDGLITEGAELAERWPAARRAFELSFGNAAELAAFLEADDGADRAELLESLVDKDFRDVRADLLESHLMQARDVRADALARLEGYGLSADDAAALFVRCVMCPRVHFENLSDWRPFILDYFDEEQRAAFATDPQRVWSWIELNLGFDERHNLGKLVGTPAGALTSLQASPVTRDTLFVAICRTLGVAARLNPETFEPEYYSADGFVPVRAEEQVTRVPLSITCADSADAPTYFATWSIARLGEVPARDGRPTIGFQTLDLEGETFADGRMELELEPGTWRVTTICRLPNGNQQASELVFALDGDGSGCGEVALGAGDALELELRVRQPGAEDMLSVIELPAVALRDEAGAPAQVACGTHGLGVLTFVQQGMEPTEHLLNELRERADDVRAAGLPVTLVARDASVLGDPTLGRMLEALPEVAIAYDDFSELPERLARRTYTNPELLPLTLLVRNVMEQGADGNGCGSKLESLYSTSGYNVGTVDLLLRLSALAR